MAGQMQFKASMAYLHSSSHTTWSAGGMVRGCPPQQTPPGAASAWQTPAHLSPQMPSSGTPTEVLIRCACPSPALGSCPR